jgi:hypothetical protein
VAITVGTGTSVYSEGTGATVDKPSGVTNGDWLIAFVGSDWGLHSAIAAPAGWTYIAAASHDGGAGAAGRQFKTFTRQVDGDGSTYLFDHNDGTSTVVIVVPIFGAGVAPTFAWAKDAASTTETAPSVTAGSAGDALICALYIAHETSSGAANYTPPSGMTEVADRAGAWSSMSAAALAPIGSSGATGSKDFSVASTSKGTPEIAVSLAVGETPTQDEGTKNTTAMRAMAAVARGGL